MKLFRIGIVCLLVVGSATQLLGNMDYTVRLTRSDAATNAGHGSFRRLYSTELHGSATRATICNPANAALCSSSHAAVSGTTNAGG